MAYDALAGDASETAHRRTVVVVVAFTAADDVWIDALVPLYSLPLSLFSPRRPPLVLWSICSGLLLLFRICPYGPSSSDATAQVLLPLLLFPEKAFVLGHNTEQMLLSTPTAANGGEGSGRGSSSSDRRCNKFARRTATQKACEEKGEQHPFSDGVTAEGGKGRRYHERRSQWGAAEART